MTSVILFIQLILIIISAASMIKMYTRGRKNKQKSMEAFRDAKETGKSVSVSGSYLNQVNLLFQKNKIKGEKIKAEGVFRTEVIKTQSKYGTSVSYEYFIDNMRVMLPKDVKMTDGENYSVEGVFYNAALYLTLINNIDLLAGVEAMGHLKPYRETIQYEEDIIIKFRKILMGILLIIGAVFPFWKLNMKVYIVFYSILILFYFFGLKRKKRILYKLKGFYEQDEFGNEIIGGVKVKAFDYSKLLYEQGDEAEVVGYKDKNNLLLIQYKGFDYIKEYKKARKFNYITNIVFIIIFAVIITVFFNVSGVKKYFEYMKVKDKQKKYENMTELSKDIEIYQYVDLSNMYLFSADFNANSYTNTNDYVLVDKESYFKELEKVEDKIRKFKIFEEKIIWLIEHIDYALVYKKNEFVENNEKYKKLKELYLDENVELEEVRQAYKEFQEDIYDELNNWMVEIQKEIYSRLDKKIIVKNIYRQGGRGYYSTFVKSYGSRRAFDIFRDERLRGIVEKVEGRENIKYIEVNTYMDYNDINDRKELLWVLGLYFLFILLLLFSTLFEIYKKIRIERQ